MKKISKLVVCIIFMMLFGGLAGEDTIYATENNNPLLEGLAIVGPDYTYEYKEKVSFTLKKDGENSNSYNEQSKYGKLHFIWSSDNESVVKYTTTINYYFSGCCGIPYPMLERPNIFKVNSGTTVIYCTISDDEGNSVVLSKSLTVLKETPIKELKVGKYKLGKEDLNADSGVIYTNNLEKNLKVEPVLDKGWELKSEKVISFDNNKDYNIKVVVENEELGQEFLYILKIRRYTQHQINIKNPKDGYAIVQRRQGAHPGIWFYALTVEYNKDSKPTDDETFKDGADLARKLIEYYHYDRCSVEYKNGFLFYKETAELKPWVYCTNKEELNNAKEDARTRNELLRDLSIEGPDYIYGIEDIAKFYLTKNGKSGKSISSKYEGFKFKWSSDNKNIAIFKKTEKKSPKKVAYPILQRLRVFKIKSGAAVIRCRITDTHGESITLMKKITVLKGRPIKALKIGSDKLKKSELNSTKCKRTIYTNKKKVKLKMNLAKGWSVKHIEVHSGKKVKIITKKKTLLLNSKKAQKIDIVLENKKSEQTFTYTWNLKKK